MNARAQQLADIGYKAWDEAFAAQGSRGRALVSALAAMLAAPAAAKAKPAGPKLAFTAQALHAALKERVSHIVGTDLVNGQSFGAANKRIGGISGLTAADLPLLVDWIEAGGFAWMTKVAPHFKMVVFKLDGWTSQARAWDVAGRPAIGVRGMAQVSLPDIGGAFK